MKIIFEKIEKTQGTIKVSINRTDFQLGVNQKIKEYSKTTNIKGFRQGKVPIEMIKKMYGNAIIVEEINKSVSEKLNAYLKEGETQFLGEPLPIKTEQEIDWENQDSFEFNYEIGFVESFDVKADKKVKLEKYFIDVNDRVVDETIENLQRQFGEMTNPEISSEKDTLFVQIKSKDGKIDREVSIDLRDVEKETLKKLVGIRNETEVEVDPKKSFKNDLVLKNQLRLDDDELKKLKKLTFTLKSINHYKLATLNQEFFDKSFAKGSIKDEAGFRNQVKEIVSHNYEDESERFFNQQIKGKFIESVKIDLPDEFLKKWLIQTNESMTQELIDFEYDQYAKELKWSLIRDQIVKNQNIKAEHEDIVNEAKELIKKQLAGSGIGNQMDAQLDSFANNYLQGEDGQNYIKVLNQVQSNKALEYIKNEVSIKEKIISLDEFRKL